jgi:hypothetical protein
MKFYQKGMGQKQKGGLVVKRRQQKGGGIRHLSKDLDRWSRSGGFWS